MAKNYKISHTKILNIIEQKHLSEDTALDLAEIPGPLFDGSWSTLSSKAERLLAAYLGVDVEELRH